MTISEMQRAIARRRVAVARLQKAGDALLLRAARAEAYGWRRDRVAGDRWAAAQCLAKARAL